MWFKLLIPSAISCHMWSSVYECQRVEYVVTSPVRTEFVMRCIKLSRFLFGVCKALFSGKSSKEAKGSSGAISCRIATREDTYRYTMALD